MDDLVAFLRARLDEDEAVTREADDFDDHSWYIVQDGLGNTVGPRPQPGEFRIATAYYAEYAEHIARYDPARVWADVAAKRELLRVAEAAADFAPTFTTGFAAKLEGVLRRFAVAYADHPDYRPEWAPVS